MTKSNAKYLLIFLIIISAYFRFYNLNWGEPFYFHPDERNIAYSVTQLHFPENLNPNFFAYGSLPIYTIYLTGILLNYIQHVISGQPDTSSIYSLSFPQAILISRAISALLSLLLIPVIFNIGTKIKNLQVGLLSAILTSFSTGMIQFAHFGTFEMWITFFSVILFWICLKILEKASLKYILLASIAFGVLISIKVSNLALLPLPILTVMLLDIGSLKQFVKINLNFKRVLRLIKSLSLIISVSAIIYLLTNPYSYLDQGSFMGSMRYESGVALGNINVFYTGGFYDTTPVVFQFLNVYPFLINPVLTILLIPALIFVIYKAFRFNQKQLVILLSFFLVLFLFNSFLFVKWTRYLVPTLPFVYIICSITFLDFISYVSRKIKNVYLEKILLNTLIGISILFSFSYFATVYIREDARVEARSFAESQIPSVSSILSEVYDLGITPFNGSFSQIKLFNFYELDNFSLDATPGTLEERLSASDYIIILSQRILKSRLQNPDKFPIGNKFYSQLVSGSNGFTKIYETPCDLFCKITYLNDPVFRFEQTSNVFDRPTVFIYKKTTSLNNTN